MNKLSKGPLHVPEVRYTKAVYISCEWNVFLNTFIHLLPENWNGKIAFVKCWPLCTKQLNNIGDNRNRNSRKWQNFFFTPLNFSEDYGNRRPNGKKE